MERKKGKKKEVVGRGSGGGNKERAGGCALYSLCPILAVGYFWTWLALRPARVCVCECAALHKEKPQQQRQNNSYGHWAQRANGAALERTRLASSRLSTRQQLVDFTSAPFLLPATLVSAKDVPCQPLLGASCLHVLSNVQVSMLLLINFPDWLMHAIDKRTPYYTPHPPSSCSCCLCCCSCSSCAAVDPIPCPSGRLVGLINGSFCFCCCCCCWCCCRCLPSCCC